jgi:hypothetical protein
VVFINAKCNSDSIQIFLHDIFPFSVDSDNQLNHPMLRFESTTPKIIPVTEAYRDEVRRPEIDIGREQVVNGNKL